MVPAPARKPGRPRKERTVNNDLFYVSDSSHGDKGDGSASVSKRPTNYKCWFQPELWEKIEVALKLHSFKICRPQRGSSRHAIRHVAVAGVSIQKNMSRFHSIAGIDSFVLNIHWLDPSSHDVSSLMDVGSTVFNTALSLTTVMNIRTMSTSRRFTKLSMVAL